MKFALSVVTAATALLGANAALAGGYTPAVAEPVVVEPVVSATPTWAGAYGGLTLGYAFNGDDEVGFQTETSAASDLGNNELSGITGGLRLGYRWQSGKFVFGPEISYEGSNADDSFTTGTFTLDGVSLGPVDVMTEMKSKATLRLKAGYEVQDNTIAYGILGVSRGTFELTVAGDSTEYKDTGAVFGVGVERKVTDRMSITGELEHNQFKGDKIEFSEGITSRETPKHTNVKLGLNFKF